MYITYRILHRKCVVIVFIVSPSPPECYFHSETKIEPDLRLIKYEKSEPAVVWAATATQTTIMSKLIA